MLLPHVFFANFSDYDGFLVVLLYSDKEFGLCSSITLA
jgi:hypothetical protein